MMIFTLFQLTNQTKDIFHFKFQIFKISRLLTTGDPVKTLSIRARLWSSSRSFLFIFLILWKITNIQIFVEHEMQYSWSIANYDDVLEKADKTRRGSCLTFGMKKFCQIFGLMCPKQWLKIKLQIWPRP